MGVLQEWLGVVLALTTFAAQLRHSQGACVYHGSLVADTTTWKPDSCQNCRCHGDMVICKPVVCRNPQCAFEKGEVLQIAANQCCPECVSRTSGSCHHEEQVHEHGTEWASFPCGMCSCNHGEVRCTQQPCPALSCGYQELEFIPEGSCCPICVGPGKACSYEGRVFQDGEDWRLSQCAKCVCRNGLAQCFTVQCPPLFCNQDEAVVRVPGKCCPQCSARSCPVAGRVYKHGEQWTEDVCTTCTCDQGELRCHKQTCPPLRCKKGQSRGRRHGQCCEECVSPAGSCSSSGIVRYQDEMWKRSACEFCMCDHGQVTCQTVECAKVECARGEELIHLDGKCCPECISSNGYCVYEEKATFLSSNASEIKHILEGEEWEDGPCKVCECRSAQVTCYQPSCPPCPVATLALVVKGQCCPECTAVHCHPDCLTCSHSPEHCDLCQDPTKLLQNGRCVHSCGLGFYQAGSLCLACQPQCSVCTSGLECSSCQPPLLMQRGQCVPTCGDGFYQDRHTCAVCHESCAGCWGPTEKHCLACRDPLQVLRDGSCESTCGDGFYNRQGTCIACDQSCKSCGPSTSRCLTCTENTVLHDGKCISECPTGYYAAATGRCKVCHNSCARCSGPAASHCTACIHPQVLHEGYCLPSCGEGFYPHYGVCKACHASCQTCVGPEPSHCTTCRKPEAALQVDHSSRADVPSGHCLSHCKARFYLESTGLCEPCHQSCLMCSGKSSQNCTVCQSSHVLLDGLCFSQCPEGYFNQEGSCTECHPTCRQCNGPLESDCLSCHPHVTLSSGHCKTSCKEEQFLNLVGYCADCHPLCQLCTADLHDTGSICLRCQNARHLLFRDHCVPHCPSGHYAERGACKRCHPSCRTCQGGGPFSCSSCDVSLVLTHTGTCSITCSPGHYLDDNRICQPCSPHCRSCDSQASCTSCRDPSKVLLFGDCQYESCAPQYYLDISTKTCRECDWSCNACSGPLRTDCLQCMDGYVLQDGVCMEQCSPSFYKDAGLCKNCDSHCLQCQGLHECTRCEGPFLLLEAQCVQECGKGYFADHTKHKCTACPRGCLQCSHRNRCHLCDHGFVLKNGLCVSSCVPGFSAHATNETCIGKIHTPSLHVNGSLTLAIGSMKPLDFSLLNIQHQDGRVEDLLFHVVSTPTNGQLVLSRNGKEVQLDKAGHFSWKDVNEKKVRFVHSKEKLRKGYFSLKISDQQFFSEPQMINILAFSTQAPYVLRNEVLHIKRGEQGTITTQLLDIRDDDNPQDVIVEVLTPPLHGQLLQTLPTPAAPIYQFRLDELSRGLLLYAHDGSESTSDVAVLQVNDGHSFQNILFHVKTVPKNDGSLRLMADSMVWVPEGGMLQITNRILQAEAPGARTEDIIYKITQDRPQFGEVVLLMNLPADSPASGGQHLPDGRTVTPTSTFTQQDIDEGIVWYRHSGAPAQSDSFRFQVSRVTDAQAHPQSRLFNIAILPQTPEAPKLSLGTSLHMTAREDGLTVIQPHSLSFVNAEQPAGKITYNITLPLHPSQGIIEHRDQPHSPIQYFTQEDVNQGKILYRPPSAAPHLQEIMAFSFAGLPESVKFHFTVSDGQHTSPQMALTIHLLPTDRQPPAFQVTTPVLKVSPGGRTSVGLQMVGRGAETALTEFFFELQKPPKHGVLVKHTAEVEAPMAAGDTFTYDDIEKNALQYIHDGSSAQEDSMEISVTDGLTVMTSEVRVQVSLPEDQGPQLAAGSSLNITVGSQSTAIITRSHLAYVDDSSPDSAIWIQLSSLPMYGALSRISGSEVEELSEFSNFTMEDINKNNIRYSAVFETDGHLVTDSFRFSVSDMDHNHLDDQIFTITVTPVKNPPPVIAFADLITVDEGGRAPLSFHHFFATDDHDNLHRDAIIKLSVLPKYGCIENTGTGDRFGPGTTGDLEASFLIQDVLENYIYYFQSVHESIEPTHDIFSFYVSDGTTRSEIHSINITIERKNDEPPRMTLRPLGVQLSSGVMLSNSSLSLHDLDTPDNELIFVLTKEPDHGHLLRRFTASEPLENGTILSQGSSFTYQDVLAGLVGYLPGDPGVAVDEFRFSLSDGFHVDTGRMEIYIELPTSDTPHLAVNRGLHLSAGSVARITEQHLKVITIGSDGRQVMYIMKEDPGAGHLQMVKHDNLEQISVKGPLRSFTQADISQGQVEYSHGTGEPDGSFAFKFDVVDGEGNRLLDQSFSISVSDKSPPVIITNKGLVLDENSVKKITTQQLSATDQESGPTGLTYRITTQPQLGHLEHAASPGIQISSFTQADLTSHNVQYVHTSEMETHADAFSFVLSDGVHEVTQTFHINLHPLDDSLPVLHNRGMRVQEGVRKTITEFELKALDADTEADSITFTILQPPRHGTIDRTTRGHHFHLTSTFTMEDIFQNRVSYSHDGSNTLKDWFTFTVSDGTNPFFITEEGGKEYLPQITTAAPQQFQVDILPVDDGTPRIVTNMGLQWLEYMDGKATNLITKKELLTVDPDTDDLHLVYEITGGPRHGYVENKLQPGRAAATFTQEDVNLGLIRYVLHEERIQEMMDSFQFLVKDSKPNLVIDNVFHIQWSLISFKYTSYNVSEKAGSVSVTVQRTGNLNQYAIILCRTEQGTASSQPGQQDYVEYAGQVQFDEREDTKSCTIVINDDDVFENIESFTVELSMPAYALLGEFTQAKVNINDTEDEPTLEFDKKIYQVNESAGFLFASVERKGDSSSVVSAVCYTIPKSAMGSSLYALESGSDFKSRGRSAESRVIFGPGVTTSTCDVMVIDDSEYEEEEEFEIALADASNSARIGRVALAKVLISGPNDASTISLGNTAFTVSEDAGTVKIPVIRHGTDLSTFTSVWCATRPSDPASATPGVDYVPSSRKVEFGPGITEQYCALTILDDIQYPVIEGLETFVVFLSSAQGAELTKPFQAVIAINDTFQDVPSMQFAKELLLVKEKEGVLHVPIIRSGDLSYQSSVRCYTQSHSAQVMEDFEERRNADSSRITFLKGEKVKNCTVYVHDDSMFEPDEQFRVYLGHPLGTHWSGARVGKNNVATITISNDEDAPTIEFEEAAYQVREPAGPDAIAILNIKVIRRGDQNRTSRIRCSTRDGSAQSGVDYYPKSRVLKFSPGVDHIFFKVEILSNEDREWHESFSLVLGPDDPVEAVLGDVTTATVTILDQEAAGSLILPAPPIVVTLADYDHVEEVSKEGVKKAPSPGYPLVCVTPCDPHFPRYTVMKERCSEAGINQSSVQFSWEVASPTDGNGARSPFETISDNTPFTSVNHMVLDSIYFSRRFHVRCVAKAVDKVGHAGTPLRSNIVTIGTDSAICHTPVVAGTARGFQAQSFIATLKYLDVKHKEHPNRIHISVQIPHQDGMLPLISTMPLHNLHFLLSESIYRHQHVCSNLVTTQDLRGISEAGFLDDVVYDNTALGPGYDRPFQFDPTVREPKTIQLYKHLNLKSCVWTFDAYYDMTELIDVCGGSVTADFQVRDSAQSFLTVHVPLYVSYIYVTAPRGWASLEHHTEMEFSFFYDTVLWRTGIQTDSVLSARLQIIRIYIREDGRLVIEFKTHAKFRGQFVMEHHTLPDVKSFILTPDHLGGIEFDLQLLWSAQTFDSPYQLWRATSSYNRKDYSGEYTIYLIPCTVQPTQPWVDPGEKPLACTAHAPERFLIPIAFQQTNRPVPVVYSLNTEFQLCNNEKVFLMDPNTSDMSLAEMDYKGAFSKGQILYGRVLWNPEQNLNSAYKLQLEKVYLCTGKDGYVPFFDPTGTIYNEGPQYGCIQPNKHLKHRFLLLDRSQPEATAKYFHDVPFDAHFASELPDFHVVSSMPGVDGFTLKVDALYKVEAGHQWYLQVIYIIGPDTISGPRVQRSLTASLRRHQRDLAEPSGWLTLDDSLIYDNEGDQVKNGTNMKSLNLEMQEPVVAASLSQTGASIGSALAAIMLLVLVFLVACFITRKCQKQKKKQPLEDTLEEYPLNTKVDMPKRSQDRVEKNVNRQYCTVRNVNILSDSEESYMFKGAKVKKMNLEVRVHNNLQDGTEV
ncbi:extracellular matrix organizing protein FRAS1 isoform X2 [Perognathus longimembris pacificus]|uniref:extracellular matrix organizing protein FRAS1 isoform X2 n=1 Tax=Perognathus longimembris pacificus TaxID=214514 RepID=UPI002018D4E2|nr:extracellular matrix organizing protein FRAS1 isoform X2 [Perognathus longimembris pacificus]